MKHNLGEESAGARLLFAPMLVVACFVAFFPALGAGFSDFDDVGFLIETQFWRGLSLSNIVEMFTTMRLGHYQPLTYLSHAIEYTLFGLNPAVFHFTNIALHAKNPDLVAWLVAMLWALNPMRVESVAWITERRDVLSAAFLLAATLMYLKHAATAQWTRAYVICIIALTLSLFSKAWGITFVAVALFLDIMLLKRLPANPTRWNNTDARRILLEKAPFALLSVIFGFFASRAVLEAGPGSVRDLSTWGIGDRLNQAIYGLGFYASHALITFEHAALRELPRSISITELRVIVPAVMSSGIAIGLFALAHRQHERARLISLALLLFMVLVSPVLGLTQAGVQLVAERYSYLSTIPLLVLLAPLLSKAIDRNRTAALIGTLMFCCVCGVLSHRQSRTWGDTLALWEQSLSSGEDGPILRNFYARQLEQREKFTLAAAEYRKSLEFDPNYGDSWFGLANALRGSGDHIGAINASKQAAAFATDTVPVNIGEGLSYVALARYDEAIRSFQTACDELERRGNPLAIGRPYLLTAAAYGESGREDLALEWLHKASQFPDTRAEAERLIVELRNLK